MCCRGISWQEENNPPVPCNDFLALCDREPSPGFLSEIGCNPSSNHLTVFNLKIIQEDLKIFFLICFCKTFEYF